MSREPISHDFTRLLAGHAAGDDQARSELFELVYAQLRAIAGSVFGSREVGHTLQPTAVVHEVYLKLARGADGSFEGRRHFLGVAAKAMRQVLSNHARDKRAQKRGGGARRATVQLDNLSVEDAGYDVVEVEDALQRLEAVDAGMARIVELRFFGGLSFAEIAELESSSESTVRRDWRMARAELLVMLGGGRP